MSIYNEKGELFPDIKDVLSELSNVGVGMASVALGKIIGMRVSIEPPRVVPGAEAMEGLLGLDPQEVAVGIIMSMEKTLGGVVLFIIEKDFIFDAVRIMTGKENCDMSFLEDEDCVSAIQELANIMAAACVKAFGDYTRIKIYLSPTMMGLDMVGALISFPLAQMEYTLEKAICIDTKISLLDNQHHVMQNVGRSIIMPDEKSVIKLMAALGM